VTFRAACLTLVFAALTPIASKAQFTAYVSPTRPNTDSAKAAIVAVQRARSDSNARASITNMKAWVDSAAGVAQTSPADTTATPPPATPPATPAPTTAPVPAAPTHNTTSFSNGARAPATASYLPLIAFLGLASLSVGIVLLAGRKRA
jgi:5'-nucleotidase / UDP-sugar diphosphatase